ncbi:Hypothetical_protein [Hexamita inflata]|uniref:Hypothetical_protein n=1 Tax=Hexamita inflata TaxID=28002 RepID=A0AA86UA25_9EUKA|nr:Hypothetical protein HINF_LOCUS37050 [Hexamita inflata]
MKDTNLLCVRHFNSNRFERVKTIPFEWNQFKVHLENKSTNLLEIGIFLIFQKVPCLKRSVDIKYFISRIFTAFTVPENKSGVPKIGVDYYCNFNQDSVRGTHQKI